MEILKKDIQSKPGKKTCVLLIQMTLSSRLFRSLRKSGLARRTFIKKGRSKPQKSKDTGALRIRVKVVISLCLKRKNGFIKKIQESLDKREIV